MFQSNWCGDQPHSASVSQRAVSGSGVPPHFLSRLSNALIYIRCCVLWGMTQVLHKLQLIDPVHTCIYSKMWYLCTQTSSQWQEVKALQLTKFVLEETKGIENNRKQCLEQCNYFCSYVLGHNMQPAAWIQFSDNIKNMQYAIICKTIFFCWGWVVMQKEKKEDVSLIS